MFPSLVTEPMYRRIRCPVLFLEGAESALRLDPAEIDARLDALRALRSAVPGAGHHPHLERPEATAEALVAFLQAGDQRPDPPQTGGPSHT